MRKPSGYRATKMGNRMNKANASLYDFTIGNMAVADSQTVLEIGFGNGNFFDRIFSEADNLLLSGLDFSADMVKAAKKNNHLAVASGRLVLALGSSDSIPFKNNSFDKIFCINVIYFWDQPADHLKEIYRVLKPGGQFYASIRTRESIVQMPFSEFGFTSYTDEEWKQLLVANGFQYVKTGLLAEPDFELNGQFFKVDSMCMIAQKPI